MATRNITSANAVYALVVAGLYPAPQQLQGFGTDAAFATESAAQAEVVMGVDGVMSAGWIPRMYRQTITLQANSPSIILFETWGAQQDSSMSIFRADATITIPALLRKYALSNGVLETFTPIPEAGRTLRQRTFAITWNTISPASI